MRTNKKKVTILFLCTGNSCRSQMAEGLAKHLKGDSIEAFSAGVVPAGLSKKAVKVMKEAGVDISGQYSKHMDELSGVDFDYVISLCHSVSEQCPAYPGGARVIHKPFEDPTFIAGSGEEVLEAFRKTRDRIRDFVKTLPEALEERGQ